MRKVVLIIILNFYMFWGYGQEVIKKIPLSHPYSEEYVNGCTKKMLETGNYGYYEIYYMHSKHRNLIYDILMADKYNNPLACYEVYCCITEMGKKYKYNIDKELWNLAFYYLQKGAEQNQSNCVDELIRIYEKGNDFVPADTIKAKYYRKKDD